MALFRDMPLILRDMDIVITALVDTLECGSLEHLVDHRVKIRESVERGLAMTALFRSIRTDAVATNNFVTSLTILCIDCDILAVSARCSREHGVRARVEF